MGARGRPWGYLALLAVTALGVASVKTIFREGILPGWDHPPHLVCSYLTATYFLPRLTVLGWDPYNNFGWVFNQFYNPGAYLLVALIQYASWNTLDINSAYKLGVLVAYILPAIGAYMLASAASDDFLAASLAALLSIVVMPQESEWLDAGLKQVYYIGMWPQRLGVGLALASLAMFWRSLKASRWKRARLIAAAAAAAAASLLSHLMTGLALLIALVLLALHAAAVSCVNLGGSRRLLSAARGAARSLATLAATLTATLGLTAFWTIPLSVTNPLYHNLPTITWHLGPAGINEFLRSIGGPQIALSILSLASAAPAARRGFRHLCVTAVLMAMLMWALSAASPYDGYLGLRLSVAAALFMLSAILCEEPGPALLASIVSALMLISTGPESFAFQLLWWKVDLGHALPFKEWYAFYKFSGLARYCAFVMSSVGLSIPIRRILRYAKGRRGAEAQLAYMAAALAIAAYVAHCIIPHLEFTDVYYPYSDLRFKLDSDFPMVEKLKNVMSWVGANVQDNTYVFYQDTLWRLGDWRDLPVSHYFYLSSMLTGKPQVGGGYGTRYITHPLANTETDYILGQPLQWLVNHPERLLELSRELGISYFVLYDRDLVNALLSRSDSFEEVYSEPPFHVFRTRTFNPIVSIDDGVVEAVTIEPGLIRIRYSSPRETTIYVRQVMYPGWYARAGSAHLAVESYHPRIPAYVWVPGGGTMSNYRVPFIKIRVPGGSHTVELCYSHSSIGDAISVVTGLALAAVVPLSLSLERKGSR